MDLEELKKQRALVASHLSWLDQKIAKEEAPETTSKLETASPANSSTPAPTEIQEDLLSEESRKLSQEDTMQANYQTKFGCLLVGVILLIAIIGLIWILPYFLYE